MDSPDIFFDNVRRIMEKYLEMTLLSRFEIQRSRKEVSTDDNDDKLMIN